MSERHWGYCNPNEDEYRCQGPMSKARAIEEGIYETSHPTHYEVFECIADIPPLPDIDVDTLVENYLESCGDELYEDYGNALYVEPYGGMKEAVKAELEEKLRVHWAAIQGIFRDWMTEHAGECHRAVNIEKLEKPDGWEDEIGKGTYTSE